MLATRRRGVSTLAVLCLVVLGACDRPAARPGADGTTTSTASATLHRIALPGDGGWDHIVAAPSLRRLFASHDSHVDVLDLDTQSPVGVLQDVPNVHGVAVAADMQRGYSSNGGDSSLTVFDLTSLGVLRRIHLREDAPDGIAYDSASHRVFALHGERPSLSVIDVGPDTVRTVLPLDGSPDGAEPDGAGRLFVTLKDKSVLLLLNGKSLAIEHRWLLAPCIGPDALTYDRERKRVLIGCDNRIAIEVDPRTGRVVSSFAIGNGVDGIAVDSADGAVLVSCGDGTLTVAQRGTDTTYHVLDVIRTARGARTQAFDPVTRHTYLPTASFASTVAADSTGRGSAVLPGTFGVLVVPRR